MRRSSLKAMYNLSKSLDRLVKTNTGTQQQQSKAIHDTEKAVGKYVRKALKNSSR